MAGSTLHYLSGGWGRQPDPSLSSLAVPGSTSLKPCESPLSPQQLVLERSTMGSLRDSFAKSSSDSHLVILGSLLYGDHSMSVMSLGLPANHTDSFSVLLTEE